VNEEQAHFEEHKYVVLRGVVDPQVASLGTRYALSFRNRFGYFEMNAFAHSLGRYADAFSESLMIELQPRLEAATGIELLPCYSYLRIYERGGRLPKHTDRDSCEISTTLTIGYDADALWPICIEADGEEKAIALDAGDLMIYRGAEIPHWREDPDLEYWVQVFLHYVDANGRFTDQRFDGRDQVGPVKMAQLRVQRALEDGPISRNAPCPCGSQRRYKHCHGASAEGSGAG